jgi:hypothetical protein
VRGVGDIRTRTHRRGGNASEDAAFLDLYVAKREMRRLLQEEGALRTRLRRVTGRLDELDQQVRQEFARIAPDVHSSGSSGGAGKATNASRSTRPVGERLEPPRIHAVPMKY